VFGRERERSERKRKKLFGLSAARLLHSHKKRRLLALR
jgi:hypothetical protein